jgi:hypothetical protein
MSTLRRFASRFGAWQVTDSDSLNRIKAVHGDLAWVTGESRWYKYSAVSSTWVVESLESDVEDLQVTAAELDKTNLDSYEEVETSDGAATDVGLTVYGTQVTTGGSEDNELLDIGDGAGAVIGQRKLVTLVDRTHASDVVVMDHGNIVNAAGAALSAVELDAEDEFILLEWNGAKWQVVYADATLTTA